jgi:uncharacterized phage-associated protein
MFPERIEAWAAGPVVRDLYEKHRGIFTLLEWPYGDAGNLTRRERKTVQVIVDSYGTLTGRQLSQLTHNERPWLEAREGLGPTDRGNREITVDALYAYYSIVDLDDTARPVSDLAGIDD